MRSLNRVTMPMEFRTISRQCSSLAVMPTMHFSRRVRRALVSRVSDSNMAWARPGSMTLSWSWPASAAISTVTSLPMTVKQTWLTTSGITGLTLAGMIEDPACISGRLISFRPARGPEDSRRRSLHILETLIARRFTAEWAAM